MVFPRAPPPVIPVVFLRGHPMISILFPCCTPMVPPVITVVFPRDTLPRGITRGNGYDLASMLLPS